MTSISRKSRKQDRCYACKAPVGTSYWLVPQRWASDPRMVFCTDCTDELARRPDHAELIKVTR